MTRSGKVYFITGAIGPETLSDFIAYLKTVPDDEKSISVVVQSAGGLVSIAFAIASLIESLPCSVRTVNFGNVDSAANIIFASGDERIAGEFSSFYVHGVQKELNGRFSAGDLRSLAREVDADSRRIRTYLAERTRTDEKGWEGLMSEGVVLDANSALKMGLATRTCDRTEFEELLREAWQAG